jgi:RNA polymerase sigma-70 factor (ECF subfamily)
MRLFSRRKLGREEVQTFYQEHGSALLLYACSLLGRKHAAEDVLHQVFMKLLEQNTMPEEPRPYLFRAVRNAALNVMRQESKDVDVTDIEPWFEAPPQDHAANVTLKSVLMQISVEQRQVLVMHIWGGLSFEEIGRVLDIPANTSASRYRYAIQRLRDRMQPQDPLCR